MALQLTRRRFTVDEYYAMATVGILGEDDRVELLDGEIIQMPPIGPEQADSVDRLLELLMQRFGDLARVRVQNPIHLDQFNNPEPDFALVRRRPAGYTAGHPTPADVFLVIEVADTSLALDRRLKMPLYARAGLPEAWVLDLQHALVHVYREPGPAGYRLVTAARPGERISPLAFPDRDLAVDALFR